MEFLTDSVREKISKLSEDQTDEIDVIESIININKENKENVKEKLFNFVEKQEPDDCIHFILGCINHAAQIRPKEREQFLFLVTSVFKKFNLNTELARNYVILNSMFGVNILLHLIIVWTNTFLILQTKEQLEKQYSRITLNRFNKFLQLVLMKGELKYSTLDILYLAAFNNIVYLKCQKRIELKLQHCLVQSNASSI